MARGKVAPKKHVSAAYNRGYCPACRVNYYRSNPGRGIITYTKPSGRNSYKGGVPSLKYFAAKRVNSRNLFRYRKPKHNYK